MPKENLFFAGDEAVWGRG